MKKQLAGILLLAGIICVGGIAYLNRTTVTATVELPSANTTTTSTVAPLPNKLLNTEPATQQSKPATTTKEYTNGDAKEAREWMSGTGRYSREERKDYEQYDEKTLQDFAQAGDLKAIAVLTTRYLEAGETEKALKYAELGIVRGSLSEIGTLAILAEPVDHMGLSDAEVKKAAIETLALNKVVGIRGDEVNAKIGTEGYIKSYKRVFKKDLELSPEDQQQIDKRALEIYESWQAKRREMGLGDFDNSLPRGAKNFFDLVK